MASVFKDTITTIRKWTWHHFFVFVLTFFAYAFFHACRKAFSNIKDTMAKSITPQNSQNSTEPYYPYKTWNKEHMFETLNDANVFLGILDTLFMFAYAVGLFISGVLGDRINLRYMLTFGMCGSAIITFLFGYLNDVIHMQNKYYYYSLFFLNGLFQSIGWPATVAIMGNWFNKSSGGLVFGLWSGNASVGNIFGSLIVASSLNYGYPNGMLLNSVLLFCGGVIVFFCLIIHPNHVGLETSDEIDSSKLVENDVQIQTKKAIGFIQACLIPGVLAYSLSHACIKLVNYTFFFWLPTYLAQGLHWEDDRSDELSNFYDIGGIIGGVAAGVISDMMRVRSPIVCIMLLLSMGSLYLYSIAGGNYVTNVALMIVVGVFVGGPANTISTAITADLGKHDKIKDNAEALSTVTGIIDGTGSFGAAIGQYLVPVINSHLGWHAVFYFLIIMAGCSLICIFPIFCKEIVCLVNHVKETRGYVKLKHVINENSA
ncbi:sugar phosphate exchanger 3-like [Hydra vulgaris]|uniref:Sugar phosphate exchanger 3 n=1 Tax=Hydra vulgaris TaxID=6087 RepID=A0ABM4CDZ4_HYDVU